MTRPNVLRVARSCAKWRCGSLLVATLFGWSCRARQVILVPIAQVVQSDTVITGKHKCVFLTLKDGTYAMLPGQAKVCLPTFHGWSAAHQ